MIAPACPMRRPGGAVCPATKPTTGFFTLRLHVRRGGLLGVAADLADHDDRVRLRILVEQLQRVEEVRADDRVAADPDAGRLSDPELRQLPDRLIGQRARARNHADVAFLVDVARHDADLALARRDDARAVRPDQPRVLALQELPRPHHVERRNAFGDADDQRHAGVGGFHDRVGRERRRHEDHGRIRAGLLHAPAPPCRTPASPDASCRPCPAPRRRPPSCRRRWPAPRGTCLPCP